MPDSPGTIEPSPASACPKQMRFGPCGGVEFDGSCEVADHPCVFLEMPTVHWAGPDARDSAVPSAGATRLRGILAQRAIVVADFPARALDAASIAACGAALAGTVDAVLAGDAPSARVQFSPSYRAHLIRRTGLEVWTGLNCRDRNRVAIEGELAGLADVGVAGVHCVTGDHTLTGARPDAAPVFDLDSTRVAALARTAGHLVSVAESPLAPPVGRRAERLLEKQRAGAEICFVNHAGGADRVESFIAQARVLGVTMSFVPCIPVVIDRASAELMLTFTTLVLPEGFLDAILAAADPRSAGITAAVELGRRMLALDGVVGVNLSGGTSPGGDLAFAGALATISQELRP
ncbi:5,10-methylenetetrahydrofolate reductase [Marisediminicola sp. UYEF4]|uniref:methylenetetrahydrofolate reductase C-terminal domain-containing protein n=1 Tax=Marisediminicola sp. UYEF4 TaxID=1756384 RepID=UPI003393E661